MVTDENTEAIACLGWGSLIWDARSLPIEPDWPEDGPLIQVEFLRQSKDNRITLVLHESAQPVPSLWAKMTAHTLSGAIAALADREGSPERLIGSWSEGEDREPSCIPGLQAWAKERGIKHVIWTDLPPKFRATNGFCPTVEEVVAHLAALSGTEYNNAIRYIQKAPAQIDTQYRRHIAGKLGWQTVGDRLVSNHFAGDC